MGKGGLDVVMIIEVGFLKIEWLDPLGGSGVVMEGEGVGW